MNGSISIKRIAILIGVIFVLAPLRGFSDDGLIVIPVAVNKPLKNIVTVAKANGKFTDPVAAVASITDASEINPYLVVIAPGVYEVTSPLQMKQYVDIIGSGVNVTTITGNISEGTEAESAIIKGASFSTLSSLFVSNSGGGGVYSIGLYISKDVSYMNVNNVNFYAAGGTQTRAIHNEAAVTTIRHVNIKINNSGGKTGIGIYNINASSDMYDIVSNISYGTNSFGIYNVSTSGSMNDVNIRAHDSTNNCGVYNGSSLKIMMNNVDIYTYYGREGYGVYNSDSFITMTNVSTVVDDGSGYGVYNDDSSPDIRRSTLDGPLDGLFTKGDGITRVSQSTIIHGAGVDTGGANMCVACDNGNSIELGSDCN
ncbi:MAG: hypothetical protein JW925_02345 [Syntrophaceae bacterium]|nr:hypothetical protein [Syntrophaceae bacterium]